MAFQWVEEDVSHPDQLDWEANLNEELDDVCHKCDGRPHNELDEPNLEVNQIVRIDIIID